MTSPPLPPPLIPAWIVLAAGADPTTVLVISQVVLSFGLPFVLIPLLLLTSNRELMGVDANGRASSWWARSSPSRSSA